MSFLTQNPVFYRCVLIARVCKKALKSGTHKFQDGLENRSKIDEKSSQNGLEMRLFSVWFLASRLAPILDRFWIDFASIFRSQNRTKIDPKRHRKTNAKKRSTRMRIKSLKKSAPEAYAHFWPCNSRPQMAVGRGVGGKVNQRQQRTKT